MSSTESGVVEVEVPLMSAADWLRGVNDMLLLGCVVREETLKCQEEEVWCVMQVNEGERSCQ